MASALALLMPSFAPLPPEMVMHLLINRRRDTIVKTSKRSPTSVTIVPTTPLEEESQFTQAEWGSLLRDIKPIQQAVFEEMDVAIREGKLTTTWISEQLLEATPRREVTQPRHRKGNQQEARKRQPRPHTGIPRSTLKGWEERGLVEFNGRNSPDPDVFAALWIARLADANRLRNWLPGKIARIVDRALDTQSAEEVGTALDGLDSRTWLACLRWDPPQEMGGPPSDPQPCPIPLPAGLSRETVLASPWQGLMWRPYWRRRINTMGVARWYGATENGWGVSLEGLSRWFNRIDELAIPNIEQGNPDVFQELSDICLNRLAYTLLSELDNRGGISKT